MINSLSSIKENLLELKIVLIKIPDAKFYPVLKNSNPLCYEFFSKAFSLFYFILLIFPTLGFSYTGEIIQSYSIPGAHPTGLTFDGEHIWLADYQKDLIYCIHPETGKLIRSIPSPAYWLKVWPGMVNTYGMWILKEEFLFLKITMGKCIKLIRKTVRF